MYQKFPLKILIFFLLLVLATPLSLDGQNLYGRVVNKKREAIAYASIFVKETRQGIASNAFGRYQLNLPDGSYTLNVSCLGYESKEIAVTIGRKENKLDIVLSEQPYQIPAVIIGSKDEDPAYNIMRKAIGMAPFYFNQVAEYESEVYLKGTLKILKVPKLLVRMSKSDPIPIKEGQIFIQESVNHIHFTAPNKYDQKVKMIRDNFPIQSQETDEIMRFINFSFYIPEVNDIVLPLSPKAFNHYNFKYAGSTIQNEHVINKIQVIPKRKSKELVSGYIYIVDDLWNLHEVDLTYQSIIGPIRIKQTLGEVEKHVWMPINFHFLVNGSVLSMKFQINYITSIKYTDLKINTKLELPANLTQKAITQKTTEPKPTAEPSKTLTKQQEKAQRDSKTVEKLLEKGDLSNREMYKLARLTKKQAKQADTTTKSLEITSPFTLTVDSFARKVDPITWQNIRPVIFTPEEIKADSTLRSAIKLANLDNNTDTIKPKRQSLIGTIAIGRRWLNEDKSLVHRFSGIINPTQLRFNTVDGLVVGAKYSFSKQYPNNRLFLQSGIDYAFSRRQPMGTLSSYFEYAGKRRGIVQLKAGYTSEDFNQNHGIAEFTNSIASLGFGCNFMKLFEHRFVSLSNHIDIANGLQINIKASFSERIMLENYSNFTGLFKFAENYTPNTPDNDLITPDNYANNIAVIGKVGLQYTPAYQYRMKGSRKVMVRSRYPTFQLVWAAGIPQVLGSNSNFNRIEGAIAQNINLHAGRIFAYELVGGHFLTKKSLFFNDFKHFNTQIVPIGILPFEGAYQNLNYYQRSTNTQYAQVQANYATPYLALKFLPYLCERLWRENLHFNSLFTHGHRPYYEIGYSISQIGYVANMGVFVGFQGAQFHSVGARISLSIFNNSKIETGPNEVTLKL